MTLRLQNRCSTSENEVEQQRLLVPTSQREVLRRLTRRGPWSSIVHLIAVFTQPVFGFFHKLIRTVRSFLSDIMHCVRAAASWCDGIFAPIPVSPLVSPAAPPPRSRASRNQRLAPLACSKAPCAGSAASDKQTQNHSVNESQNHESEAAPVPQERSTESTIATVQRSSGSLANRAKGVLQPAARWFSDTLSGWFTSGQQQQQDSAQSEPKSQRQRRLQRQRQVQQKEQQQRQVQRERLKQHLLQKQKQREHMPEQSSAQQQDDQQPQRSEHELDSQAQREEDPHQQPEKQQQQKQQPQKEQPRKEQPQKQLPEKQQPEKQQVRRRATSPAKQQQQKRPSVTPKLELSAGAVAAKTGQEGLEQCLLSPTRRSSASTSTPRQLIPSGGKRRAAALLKAGAAAGSALGAAGAAVAAGTVAETVRAAAQHAAAHSTATAGSGATSPPVAAQQGVTQDAALRAAGGAAAEAEQKPSAKTPVPKAAQTKKRQSAKVKAQSATPAPAPPPAEPVAAATEQPVQTPANAAKPTAPPPEETTDSEALSADSSGFTVIAGKSRKPRLPPMRQLVRPAEPAAATAQKSEQQPQQPQQPPRPPQLAAEPPQQQKEKRQPAEQPKEGDSAAAAAASATSHRQAKEPGRWARLDLTESLDREEEKPQGNHSTVPAQQQLSGSRHLGEPPQHLKKALDRRQRQPQQQQQQPQQPQQPKRREGSQQREPQQQRPEQPQQGPAADKEHAAGPHKPQQHSAGPSGRRGAAAEQLRPDAKAAAPSGSTPVPRPEKTAAPRAAPPSRAAPPARHKADESASEAAARREGPAAEGERGTEGSEPVGSKPTAARKPIRNPQGGVADEGQLAAAAAGKSRSHPWGKHRGPQSSSPDNGGPTGGPLDAEGRRAVNPAAGSSQRPQQRSRTPYAPSGAAAVSSQHAEEEAAHHWPTLGASATKAGRRRTAGSGCDDEEDMHDPRPFAGAAHQQQRHPQRQSLAQQQGLRRQLYYPQGPSPGGRDGPNVRRNRRGPDGWTPTAQSHRHSTAPVAEGFSRSAAASDSSAARWASVSASQGAPDGDWGPDASGPHGGSRSHRRRDTPTPRGDFRPKRSGAEEWGAGAAPSYAASGPAAAAAPAGPAGSCPYLSVVDTVALAAPRGTIASRLFGVESDRWQQLQHQYQPRGRGHPQGWDRRRGSSLGPQLVLRQQLVQQQVAVCEVEYAVPFPVLPDPSGDPFAAAAAAATAGYTCPPTTYVAAYAASARGWGSLGPPTP